MQPIQLTEEEQLEISRKSKYSISSALGVIAMVSGALIGGDATANIDNLNVPQALVGAAIVSIGALANLRSGFTADILEGENDVLQRRLAQKEGQE